MCVYGMSATGCFYDDIYYFVRLTFRIEIFGLLTRISGFNSVRILC